MKKAIASKYTESIIVIERADWSIDFYDVETGRHYTRRVWYPVHGSDIYVQHRGGFYSIMTEYKGKYDPQAISRYETVSADELKSMTAEIIARRAGKQHADELTWEETTRVYAYAIVCNDADTEATMTAVVNDILQNRTAQPEPAEAAAAAARALLAEYADAIGEHPTDDDPETRAAYRIARHDIAHQIGSTASDREIVAAMVEAIAQAVRDDMPTGPEGYHAEHIADPLAKYRSVEYLEFDAPRPTYQRAELLAYLGEPDDYDVTAIEHDATAYDPATGRTVWAVDAETLAAIAERHQLQFYAPAF